MRWQQQRAGSSSSIRWSAAAGGRWTHQIKHVEPSCLLIGLCWTIFNFFCDYWLWLIIILNISKYCLRNPCSTLFCLPPFWPSCSSDVNINGGSFFGRLWFRSKGPAPAELNPILGVWKEVSTGGRRLEMLEMSTPDFVKPLGCWPLERYHFLVANDLTCGGLRPILKVLINHGSSAPSQCRGQKAGYLARIISLGVYDILIYFMMSNIRILIMGRMTHTIFWPRNDTCG